MNESNWQDELTNSFAAALRERRKHLGLRVQDVADRSVETGRPVPRTTITDYELGRRGDRIMLADVLTLSEVLGLSVIEILSGVPLRPHPVANRVAEEREEIYMQGREAAVEKLVQFVREY